MGLNAVNPLAATIPESVYMFFQMTFAIITPALIAGALADPHEIFGVHVVHVVVAAVCLLPDRPLGVGRRMARRDGSADYAGGTVVHLNAGTAALITCLVLGKRKGLVPKNMAPHNLVSASLAHPCCGSVGSASTPVQPSQQM